MINFSNKNILILGYGKSGESAKNLLEKIANKIFIYDSKFTTKILNNNKNYKKINKNNYFLQKNIYFCNNLSQILKNKIHFAILSPGISKEDKIVKKMKKLGIKILSELELGSLFCKGKIFAITGSNGKTTTVNLLYEIFKTANKETFLCGNVGTPICDIAKNTTKKSLIVVEVSSFQLESCKNFKPYLSAILNITSDHIDRHKNMKNYALTKNKINNNFETIKIFNLDDFLTNKISKFYFNKKTFSLAKPNVSKDFLNKIKQQTNLIGDYNLSNILCAVSVAKIEKIKPSVILNTIKNFKPLNHRLEKIKTDKNITYINDSKSTNPASTVCAITAIKENIILLLGGSNKNTDFAPIFNQQIFCVICFGENKDHIIASYNKLKTNIKYFIIKENFNSAVEHAIQFAKQQTEKITVLLSPASASFDEFTSYKERGEKFKKIINLL